MIQVVKRLDEAMRGRIAGWLIPLCMPALRLDASSYARGRQRVWLGLEPSLTRDVKVKLALKLQPEQRAALAEAIEWRFDWALVTYSGDDATGITPHRDASFAAPLARGLNLAGKVRFDYWENGLDGTGKTTLDLMPGDVIAFDCKRLHACAPQPRRWNVNFWRAK